MLNIIFYTMEPLKNECNEILWREWKKYIAVYQLRPFPHSFTCLNLSKSENAWSYNLIHIYLI